MRINATDLKKSETTADVIYQAVREAILSGEIRSGEHLRQDALAKMFNTSRVPVREALTRLEQQGLVTTERYRGTTVSTLSADEVEEITHFRAIIESEIIKIAVPNLDANALGKAELYCQEFADEEDSAKWALLNRNFHNTLYESANRPYFLAAIHNTYDRVESYLRALLVLTNGMQKARAEHIRILEACKKGDADLAAKLTRDHITDAGIELVEYLRRRDQT